MSFLFLQYLNSVKNAGASQACSTEHGIQRVRVEYLKHHEIQ